MSNATAPDLAARIDALLPQTQCTRCGFPGCSPYAAAIVSGEAQINQCPPGGQATIDALARLSTSRRRPLNPRMGRIAGAAAGSMKHAARLRPLLKPCPVDAIISRNYAHRSPIAAPVVSCACRRVPSTALTCGPRPSTATSRW